MVEDTFTTSPIETGFEPLVTATVTTEALTPDGIEAAKALVRLPEIDTVQLAKLARDIAMNIMEWPKVLQKHNLTQAQYDWLSTYNDFYKNLLSHLIKEWQGIDSTEKRIRAQSMAALEDLLPVIAGRMGRPAEKLIEVIEGAKLLATVGGVDSKQQGARASAEGFAITIDLGADTRLTIGPQAPPSQGAKPPRTIEVSANGGGAAGKSPVQADPQGQGGTGPLRQIAAGPGTDVAGRSQSAGQGTPPAGTVKP